MAAGQPSSAENEPGGLEPRGHGNGSGDGQERPVNDMLWVTTERIPDVILRLPAAEDAVPIVRQALGGVADAVGMRVEQIEDIKVAVTEACRNVILHAYDAPGAGILAVCIALTDSMLEVTVVDRGRGFRSAPHAPGGVGLHAIAALTDTFRVSPGFPGTRVIMRFRREDAPRPAA